VYTTRVIRAGWHVRIDRPQQQVYDFVADPANASVWSTGNDRFEPAADVSTPPGELAFVARRPAAFARVRFRFVSAGERATDVSCDLEMELHGAMRLAEPLLAGIMRRGLEASRGPALKEALERLPAATSG
jgi:hypothetical protein